MVKTLLNEKSAMGGNGKLAVALAVAATSLACLRAYALLEVSGDFTITGAISAPVVFTGDATLTIAANVTTMLGSVTNDGHTVTINLESGCAAGLSVLQSRNSASTKFNFNGGRLTDGGGWGSYWFYSDSANCKIELASVDGNPIWFDHSLGQQKYMKSSGDVFSSGTGCLLVQTADTYVNPNTGAVTILGLYQNLIGTSWRHTGGTCFRKLTGSSKPGQIVCMGGNDRMPSGLVELGQSGESVGAWLDLGGTTETMEQLVSYGTVGGVTNRATAAGTLVFNVDGAILDAPVYGNAIVKKTGSASTLTLKRGPVSSIVHTAGTLLVKPDAIGTVVKVGSLATSSGATVVVDGCTLEVDSIAEDMGSFSFVNGGKLRMVAGTDANANMLMEDSVAMDAASGITKVGTGTLTLHREAALDDVFVKAGTLALAKPGSTNHWLRFSFTKMYNDKPFEFSQLSLVDAAGNRVDGGGSAIDLPSSDPIAAGQAGSRVANVAYDCAPQNMPAQSIWVNDSNWVFNNTGYRSLSPSAIFDARDVTYLKYSDAPTVANPKIFVVRMPTGTTETYGYKIRVGYSGARHPSDWKVETSPDGINWTESDLHSGIVPQNSNGWEYNGGAPYKLMSGRDGATGLSATAMVQVDAGATLDCSRVTGGQLLSNLTVDYATGGGTLSGVKLAAGGTLNLVNVPAGVKLNDYAVPLTFVGATDTANATSWTLFVNGAVSSRRRLTWQDGGLRVCGRGTTVVIW